MRETAFALGIGLFLLLISVLLTLPSESVMVWGTTIMLGGAAVGLPLELYYFTALAVALGRRSVLPRGWYWRSFAHHHLLEGTERWIVLPAFYAGALAFVVCMLGIVVAMTGLVAALLSL